MPSAPSTSRLAESVRMDHLFSLFSARTAAFAGKPAAFALAFATVLVWAVTGPLFDYSEDWQLVINTGTTIVTFLMVFLVQNSQNCDSAAIQAKLDELIRAVTEARDEFIGIEHMTDAEIEAIRLELERDFGHRALPATPARSVYRLLRRR